MKKQYITLAPNGKNVSISHKNKNYEFKHNQIIEDENIALIFPNIFIEMVSMKKDIPDQPKMPENTSIKEEITVKNLISGFKTKKTKKSSKKR